jgi:hypothetical protein
LKGDKETTEKANAKTECGLAGEWSVKCRGRIDPHHILHKLLCSEEMRNDDDNLVYPCRAHHDYIETHREKFNAWLEKHFPGRLLRLKQRANGVIERWVPIADYPDYDISDWGRVISRKCGKSALRSLSTNDKGYPTVILCKPGVTPNKRFRVHRLVACAFLGAPADGRQFVNHKDGNKLNAHYTNLEWVHPQENTRHAFETGLCFNPSGESHPSAKISESQVREILNRLKTGESGASIASDFNIHTQTVFAIKHGRSWRCLSQEHP